MATQQGIPASGALSGRRLENLALAFQEVLTAIVRLRANAFPVTDEGIVVGLVTLSQVKEVPRDSWAETRVADIMTPLADTLIVDPGAPMEEVVRRMAENGTRRVIVARQWEIQGVITAGDIANWLERAGLGT